MPEPRREIRHEPGSVSAAVARNLRAQRASQRLRQQDIADGSGLSRSAVAALEDGVRRVGADDLPGLCDALALSLRDLLDGDEFATVRDRLGLDSLDPRAAFAIADALGDSGLDALEERVKSGRLPREATVYGFDVLRAAGRL